MTLPLLVVGEIIVDFTLTSAAGENKLRLGGIAHAARGLWALGIPFAAGAVCPGYLRRSAQDYLEACGCIEFIELGEVHGAPNVIVIRDPIEVGDQGYETLLRDEKTVSLNDVRKPFSKYRDALVFPGTFDLAEACQMLSGEARLHIDVAYDIEGIEILTALTRTIETIMISTSSDLFRNIGSSGIEELSENLAPINPSSIVLKENRGGARIQLVSDGKVEKIPAILGSTVNSVGVGDVFSAAFVALRQEGPSAAAWKAARTSSAYAQTTEPDIFHRYVERSLKLTIDQMKNLGGVFLPWEERSKLSIYLAAPDFSCADRRAIDEAVRSLEYHNFRVRRPIQENGELAPEAGLGELKETYGKDLKLLSGSALVFAIPTDRDPGTLVEVGMAIQLGIPVVVYDPKRECRNTMVMAGANCYSQSLDECLNAVFTALSEKELASDE